MQIAVNKAVLSLGRSSRWSLYKVYNPDSLDIAAYSNQSSSAASSVRSGFERVASKLARIVDINAHQIWREQSFCC